MIANALFWKVILISGLSPFLFLYVFYCCWRKRHKSFHFLNLCISPAPEVRHKTQYCLDMFRSVRLSPLCTRTCASLAHYNGISHRIFFQLFTKIWKSDGLSYPLFLHFIVPIENAFITISFIYGVSSREIRLGTLLSNLM